MGYGKSRWWFEICVDLYSEGLGNDFGSAYFSGDSTTSAAGYVCKRVSTCNHKYTPWKFQWVKSLFVFQKKMVPSLPYKGHSQEVRING